MCTYTHARMTHAGLLHRDSSSLLAESPRRRSMDDLLPILELVNVKAGLRHLYSEMMYIADSYNTAITANAVTSSGELEFMRTAWFSSVVVLELNCTQAIRRRARLATDVALLPDAELRSPHDEASIPSISRSSSSSQLWSTSENAE